MRPAPVVSAALANIERQSPAGADAAQRAIEAAAADKSPRAKKPLARLVGAGNADIARKLYQETIIAADGNVLAAAAALGMSRASAYRVVAELGLGEWLEQQYPGRRGTAGAAVRHGR